MPFNDWSTGYVVSPDGEKLAVLSESEAGSDFGPATTGLWLYEFGSQKWQRLVEFEAQVSTSPGAGLYVSADAALALKRKGTPPPSWSADSERLTYYKTYNTEGPTYHAELWLHDLRDNSDTMLTDSGWTEAWSPDGSYLAYHESGSERIVLLGPEGESAPTKLSGTFAWAPDGRLITTSQRAVTLYDPATGEEQELTYEGKAIGGAVVYPAMIHASPSGTHFSFTTAARVNGMREGVFVVDLASGEVTRIVDKSGVSVTGWLGG
jgi:Tol biopolymer transport system component